MNKDSNTLKDLFTDYEMDLYNKTEYPFNLFIVDTALKGKLADNSDYEVWVPLVYYKLSALLKAGAAVLKPYKTFISNKGIIACIRNNEYLILARYVPNDYYASGVTCGKNNQELLLIHRALACSFIPVGPELDGSHPKDLQVNHRDGVKLNIPLDNLEWTTPSGNMAHAFENGLNSIPKSWANKLSKPVKGKVLIGEFAGFEFILCGNKELRSNGFNSTSARDCCIGRLETHRNCSWSFPTQEEIDTLPKEIPADVNASISVPVVRKPKLKVV